MNRRVHLISRQYSCKKMKVKKKRIRHNQELIRHCELNVMTIYFFKLSKGSDNEYFVYFGIPDLYTTIPDRVSFCKKEDEVGQPGLLLGKCEECRRN